MTEVEFMCQQLNDVVYTLRRFHVPGGEQYTEDNPVDIGYLADHIEALVKKVNYEAPK